VIQISSRASVSFCDRKYSLKFVDTDSIIDSIIDRASFLIDFNIYMLIRNIQEYFI